MYKAKQIISALLLAYAISAEAQISASELVKNNPIVQLERGQSIDVYGEYTLVGSTFGLNGVNGAAMLFHNNQHIRDYRVSTVSDGAGRFGTIGIDQHALVVAAPGYVEGGLTKGKIAIFNKTWNGTHYSTTVSQSYTESTGETGFGTAVSISDNYIAVGAPERNVEGGVKMFFRNPSNGVWEDKGWLPLPNLENAPFRYRSGGGPTFKSAARFGAVLQIHRNNMIIGAPGIGSFYIYEFNGTSWVYKSENKGTKDLGHSVAISDEYAASGSGGLELETFKKGWDNNNPWPYLQTIVTETPANSIATDGSRLVLGERAGGTDGRGKVSYYEIRSRQIPGTNTWVNDFSRIGRMFVNVTASPYGMKEYRLLGYSVAIHQNTVVAGAPNTRYSGFADGAGFRGNFYQYTTSARMEENEEETQTTEITPTLYPNPASNAISISAANIIVSASAVSQSGEKVSLDFTGNQINTSNLSKGTYIITIETVAGTKSEKVVIW